MDPKVFNGLFGVVDEVTDVTYDEMAAALEAIQPSGMFYDFDKHLQRERSIHPPVSEKTKKRRKANKAARVQRRNNR